MKLDSNDLESLCQALFELDNTIEALKKNAGIDELEEQKDAAVQGLKDQIEIIEKQKEALQDQLDYLEKQREEREIMLNIQKEQYKFCRD